MATRIFAVAAAAAMVLILAGCPMGGDTTSPTFAGLATATADGLTQAVLSWLAATDDTTAQSNLVYDIWKGSVSSVPTNGAPAHTTGPGATGFTVTGLPGAATTYFVVKARDEEGNRDANTVAKSVAPSSAVWSFVDGGLATGINDGDSIYSTTAGVVGGALYAMWTEYDTSPLLARTAVYNGNDSSPTWTDIDAGAGVGMNYDIYSLPNEVVVVGMRLTGFGGRLYATWSESDDSYYQIRVAVYSPSPPAWTFVDGNLSTGLNYSPSMSASEPTLVVNGTTLYALWIEWGLPAEAYQVRAAAYNGNDAAPDWTFVDGDGADGINYAASDSASYLSAASFGGRLVAAWVEAGLLRVKSYNGSSWSAADQGALNMSEEGAYQTSLATSGGRLYLAWQEYDLTVGVNLIRSKVFGGDFASPSWSSVDGNGHTGLNFDATMYASTPRLADLNGGLVITFVESNGTANQIRAKAFNGNLGSPAWLTIDGGASDGLNHDPIYTAGQPYPVAFDGKLYITFAESSGVSFVQTRVIRGR